MVEHDAAGHVSPDDQYLETPPGAEYEHTDASIGIIVKFLVWLAVSAVVIHVGLGLMYGLLIRQSREVGEPRYPLANASERRLPPMPRLQQFPPNELYQFRISEEDLLHTYGWMNKNAGTVHIPIDDAMRLAIDRGVVRSRAQDGAQLSETPGLMPADSSAGRTMERRRQ
jgi:hypothetical protein